MDYFLLSTVKKADNPMQLPQNFYPILCYSIFPFKERQMSFCILCGFRAIRLRRHFSVHKKFKCYWLSLSRHLFLISYIYYHYNHGSTAFLGQGIVRPIYFFILISHLILAAITLPAVLVTFYFAFISQFKLHTAISTYTLYAWLYVSLSGIVIYGFLKHFNSI